MGTRALGRGSLGICRSTIKYYFTYQLFHICLFLLARSSNLIFILFSSEIVLLFGRLVVEISSRSLWVRVSIADLENCITHKSSDLQ